MLHSKKVVPLPFSTLQYLLKLEKYLVRYFLVLIFLGLSGTLSAQSREDQISIVMPTDARVIRVDAKIDQWVYAGDTLAVLKDTKGAKFKFRAGVSGQLVLALLFCFFSVAIYIYIYIYIAEFLFL